MKPVLGLFPHGLNGQSMKITKLHLEQLMRVITPPSPLPNRERKYDF
jgi:hypothetical protein